MRPYVQRTASLSSHLLIFAYEVSGKTAHMSRFVVKQP
jgi:hypothetical protein